MIEYSQLVDAFEDVWCNDQRTDSRADCVYIRTNPLKNNSLCLSQLNCQEEMPFICQSKFDSMMNGEMSCGY